MSYHGRDFYAQIVRESQRRRERERNCFLIAYTGFALWLAYHLYDLAVRWHWFKW